MAPPAHSEPAAPPERPSPASLCGFLPVSDRFANWVDGDRLRRREWRTVQLILALNLLVIHLVAVQVGYIAPRFGPCCAIIAVSAILLGLRATTRARRVWAFFWAMTAMLALYVSEWAAIGQHMKGALQTLFFLCGGTLFVLLTFTFHWRVLLLVNAVLSIAWARVALAPFFTAGHLDWPWSDGVSYFLAGAAIQGVMLALRRLVDLTRAGEDRRLFVQSRLLQDAHAENDNLRYHLSRVERIDVVERMTTTFAHEIRQPLGSALAYSQAAARWLNRDEPNLLEAKLATEEATAQLVRIKQAIETIHRLTARLPTQPIVTNVADIAQRIYELVRADLIESGHHVVLSAKTGEAPPLALVQEDEIGQVLLNLVRNSLEAFAQRGRFGHITVFVKEEGSNLLLGVRDTAGGFPEDDRAPVVGALKTTKTHGTGLGLALSREIARRNNGRLEILNEPMVGACVQLRLPRIASAPSYR